MKAFFFLCLFLCLIYAQNYCNDTILTDVYSVSTPNCVDIYDKLAITANFNTILFFQYNGSNWLIQQSFSSGALACSMSFNWAVFQTNSTNFDVYYLNETWSMIQNINMFYPISDFDLYYNVSTGMTLVIGTSTFNSGQGKAYVYSMLNNFFAPVTELYANNTNNFGFAVSAGNGFIICSSDINTQSGDVYLFGQIFPLTNQTSYWVFVTKFTTPIPNFGQYIDLSSEIGIIGYPGGFNLYTVSNLTRIILAQQIPATYIFGITFQNNVLLDARAEMYYRFNYTWTHVYETYGGALEPVPQYNVWGLCTIYAGATTISFYCTDNLNECNMCNRCKSPSDISMVTSVVGNYMNMSFVRSNPNCTGSAYILEFPNCIQTSSFTVSGSGCSTPPYLTIPGIRTLNETVCSMAGIDNINLLCVPDPNCVVSFQVFNQTMISGPVENYVVGENTCSAQNITFFDSCAPIIPPNATVTSNANYPYSNAINYYIVSYTPENQILIPLDICADVLSITGCSAVYRVVDCISGCPSCSPTTFNRYIEVNFTTAIVSGAYTCNLYLNMTKSMTIAYGNVSVGGACFNSQVGFNCTVPVFTSGGVTSGSVTSGPLTTRGITTRSVSTGSISTGAITSGKLTTAKPQTSGQITTNGLTTGGITTGSISTGAITTGPVTTGITTSYLTTGTFITTNNPVHLKVKTEIVGVTVIPFVGVLVVILFYFAASMRYRFFAGRNRPSSNKIQIEFKQRSQ